MSFRFLSPALDELAEAAEFYQQSVPGLGADFIHEVDRSIDLILGFPEAWGRLSDTQRKSLSGQLQRLLQSDQAFYDSVQSFFSSAFTRRRGLKGHALARHLKRRKADDRSAGTRTFRQRAAELSDAERESLRKKFSGDQ